MCLCSTANQLSCFHLAGREQKRFSSNFSQGLLLPPQPWQHWARRTTNTLFLFSFCLTNLTAAPSQSSKAHPLPQLSSSSSLEGRAASLPTQIITRAAFSAMLAGNFRLNGTEAKVYHPKLSKSSILPSHFSASGLQLVSHCQGSSRRVYPTSLQPAGSRGHHTITDVIYTLPSCSRVNL